MNYYERLLKRVKMLNIELSVNAASAHSKSNEESPTEYGGDRDTYTGRADAYDDAKQLVEKILEDFPDKLGVAVLENLLEECKVARP